MATALVRIHPDNVQATVAHTYARPLCRYLFFTFGSAEKARRFVGRLLPRVTSAARWDAEHDDPRARLLNVALTFPGLQATKVITEAALSQFARAYRGGANPVRLHDGAGSVWWNGVPAEELHCLVSLYASTEPELAALTADVLQDAADTGNQHRLVRPDGQTIDGQVLTTPRHVHFGYLDGFSGPTVAWSDPAQNTDIDFRHFLLGYSTAAITSDPREFAGDPGSTEAVEFARDGSYGALRMMYQDVAAFNRFVAANAARLAGPLGMTPDAAAIWLKEKMLGRAMNGKPLSPRANGQPFGDTDDFRYANDTAGQHCPFTAHVRVVNPRDQRILEPHAPVPRLLRRGMPYGPELTGTVDDGIDRGLIGLFLCSSLTFQFEKVMDWINKTNFSEVFREIHWQDPLLGNREVPLALTDFVIPMPDGTEVVATGLTTFVKTRGTSYVLFPSMKALGQIAAAG